MANLFLFANQAYGTLAAPITSGATSVTITLNALSNSFPVPSAGQQFAITFNDAATGTLTEIVYCTAVSGSTYTIVRAQEGTTALSWLAGDLAANLFTSGQANSFLQSAGQNPARIVTASGSFTMTTADANGAVDLNRTSGVGVSSTTLPSAATVGQVYRIEDLAGNFNAYPVTVNPPGGMTIGNENSILLNINGQSAAFRFYGSNTWSWKP